MRTAASQPGIPAPGDLEGSRKGPGDEVQHAGLPPGCRPSDAVSPDPVIAPSQAAGPLLRAPYAQLQGGVPRRGAPGGTEPGRRGHDQSVVRNSATSPGDPSATKRPARSTRTRLATCRTRG